MKGNIYNLAIPEDERVMQTKRVRNLLRIYQKGHMNKAELEETYAEWKAVAERLKKGERMIHETTQKIKGDPNINHHYVSLTHLYEMLVSICGIYDGFFQSMFRDRPDHYQQALKSIMRILD